MALPTRNELVFELGHTQAELREAKGKLAAATARADLAERRLAEACEQLAGYSSDLDTQYGHDARTADEFQAEIEAEVPE
jgi:hypothetical protein